VKFLDRFWKQQKEKEQRGAKKQRQEGVREKARATSDGTETFRPMHEERAARTAHVVRMPHVTEKAARVASAQNQYVFRVAPRATKIEIRQAFEAIYDIRPLSVTTTTIPRKPKRLGKSQGFKSGYKKAIIRLPQGKTIEIMPR